MTDPKTYKDKLAGELGRTMIQMLEDGATDADTLAVLGWLEFTAADLARTLMAELHEMAGMEHTREAVVEAEILKAVFIEEDAINV